MPNRHQTDASVEDSDLARILRRDRRRVVCGFLALALTWILGSDFAVKALAPDLATAMLWQTFKGTLFVIVSAIVLAMLLRPLAQHVLHAHSRLRASEVRYRAMFQGNPGPILVYDMDTMQVLDVNPAACSLFGWTREEFKALQVNALWAPSHDAAMQAQLDHVRAHPDEQCVTDGPLLLKDGSLRHMEMRSNGIRWGSHRARLFIAVDRSAEELALQRRDQALGRLEEAHEMARIGAWELDPASGMGRYSRQIYHLLGRRPPQARHWHRFEELLIPADPATAAHCENLLEQMRAEDNVQIDVLLPLLALDGHQVMAHIRAESGIDEQGRPRVLGTLQDVSEREHSRRLLRLTLGTGVSSLTSEGAVLPGGGPAGARAQGHGSTIHVAVVSANAFDKGLENDVGIRPEDFIVKPVRHSELLDWLERRLALQWTDAPAPCPADAAAAAVAAGPGSSTPAPAAEPPDPATLGPLTDAVALGYYRGVLQQLAAIEAAQPACAAWAAEMRALAQRFQFEAMAARLPSAAPVQPATD